MTALNPISTPLNSTVLIEASAGTGKTYTITSLYLRLLLQAGENGFSHPLSVEQILVVTFTEAATQELRGRIRERIHLAKQQLIAYIQQPNKAIFDGTDNAILRDLVDKLDLHLAVQQLHLAEQNMDLAAIYTIHGFCRRMLVQYAFNSGVYFNLQLNKDENKLIERFCAEVWREYFYPASLPVAQFIHQQFISPSAIAKQIRAYVNKPDLKAVENEFPFLQLPLTQFLPQITTQLMEIQQTKQHWLDQHLEIEQLIRDELAKKYKSGEPKRLKRGSFKSNHIAGRFADMLSWAKEKQINPLPEKAVYFSQRALAEDYVEEGAEPITHPIFAELDLVTENFAQFSNFKRIILYHYIQLVSQKLADYKQHHQEKNFDDLLLLLKNALYSVQGDEFAAYLRHQYPFAMIDEFQDTDNQQYQIFSKIYMSDPNADCGFLMIGDPKQAIYQFRGADIFTYLKAAEQATQRFTLDKNYRSSQGIIESVNAIFDFSPSAPFLYQNIPFSPVNVGKNQGNFVLNHQIQAPLGFYFAENKAQAAQICATEIAQWLNAGEQAYFDKGQPQQIQTQDIAILVRDRFEAAIVKQALQQFAIAAVYLSDDSNVFDSKQAKELRLVLMACLNPLSERHILNAIATTIFALTTAEIQHLKQNEDEWEQWVNRFVLYHRIWQKQGVLAMLHRLFLDEKIPQKMFAQGEGERLVTDLFHLAELLQDASRLNETESALLRWYERQLQGENRQDEQRIRLESEQQLVKIVTIHKSKGLEYGLVWLPFISNPAKKPQTALTTYYDTDKQQMQWDMKDQHLEQINKERLAEEMRLLYVALTRAKYRLSFALPTTFEKQWNSLLYALTEGEIGEQFELSQRYESHTLLARLQQRLGEKNVVINPQPIESQPIHPVQKQAHFSAAEFRGHIEQNWEVVSFSSLQAAHQWHKYAFDHTESRKRAEEKNDVFSTVIDQSKDLDFALTTLPEALADSTENYFPFHFPHGVKIGTELHRYLEKYPFNQNVNQEGVARLCQALQLTENHYQPVTAWLQAILNTPLGIGAHFSLGQLAPKDCLKEMQFYLKLDSYFPLTEFNRLLRQHHHLYCEDWQFDQLKGLIRGFVDLVFRHQGKYYILDYKSNFLGNQWQHYAKDALAAVMQHNQYDLQYLLYTLALHRYLLQRDSNYDYEQHFGGVIYAFLRGMNGENAEYGLFFDKPKAELIHQLDELF